MMRFTAEVIFIQPFLDGSIRATYVSDNWHPFRAYGLEFHTSTQDTFFIPYANVRSVLLHQEVIPDA